MDLAHDLEALRVFAEDPHNPDDRIRERVEGLRRRHRDVPDIDFQIHYVLEVFRPSALRTI